VLQLFGTREYPWSRSDERHEMTDDRLDPRRYEKLVPAVLDRSRFALS
jgi:hypothetical protein